ncbi:MAG: DNA repair protein RecN [Alphaproteobacteria bacterium]|nr:DNA repair protein RecN [Alphaproteobacteria bacterium]
MLTNLHISNIVLIEKLNLEFGGGLNILTGETGAGKSILMDALSLALGARSDTGLVRAGCDTASVTAEFDNVDTTTKNILIENGLDADTDIILRRTLSVDGKSRAWINDVPVSVKVLKEVGDSLVEIHGQFANHTLLNPAVHRPTLDAFAALVNPEFIATQTATKTAYNALHTIETQIAELQDLVSRAETEREFLEHNVNELRALKIRVGEEQELATARANMMNAEKNAAILNDALSALAPNGNSLDSLICNAAHILERVHGDGENPYQEQIDNLYDAAQMVAQVSTHVKPETTDIGTIDEIEERLFAIRAVARKHRVAADELPNKLAEMETALNSIDNSDAELQKLKKELTTAKQEFDAQATKLSKMRHDAATAMRASILQELPDLKLGSADFMVDIKSTAPCANGVDDVLFMIKTNPGNPFAPLNKSASGGELARFMLALRVTLAGGADSHTFVFDEIDTGISGATASAVGARLNRLSQNSQSLVITHSAQVAGFADRHYKIAKHVENDKTITTVTEISGDDRVNEIARIISGTDITPESIATAKTLLKN